MLFCRKKHDEYPCQGNCDAPPETYGDRSSLGDSQICVMRIGLLSIFFLGQLAALAGLPGSLDASFDVGTGSTYGDNAVLVQPDGKIIVAGYFASYRSVIRQGIVRLMPDASIDFTFDPTNNVAGSVRAAYLYPDGRILVAGGFYMGSGANRNRVARLNSYGTLDQTFDPGAGPDADVTCLAVQPDGKILIGGRFASFAGKSKRYITRLNANGTLDTNFFGSADYHVTGIALQPDGKIIVGGWFFHLNGTSQPNLARLNSDGTLDTSFSANLSSPVQALALQRDAKLLFSTFAPETGPMLRRIMPNGSPDAGFYGAMDLYPNVIFVDEDGKILIGGSFNSVNGASRAFMARLYSDGSTDESFSAQPDNAVDFVAKQGDGRYIIAGGFGYVEHVEEAGLARLYGDDQMAVPAIEINGKAFQAFQSDTNIIIPLVRSGNTNASVQVQFGTVDMEAQAGSDYLPRSGTLSFAPGELVKTVSIPLLNDGAVHNLERFGLYLTNVSGGTFGRITNAIISVLGVNGFVQISTPDFATNELAGSVTIYLSRVGTNTSCSVLCRTLSDTALAGINFSNFQQTVSFAPGQATNTINILLLDDYQVGPDKFFLIQISDPSGVQIGSRSNLTLTLLENDAPGHPASGVNGFVSALSPTSDGGMVLGGNYFSINGTMRIRLGKVQSDASVDPDFATGSGADGIVSAVLTQNCNRRWFHVVQWCKPIQDRKIKC
jgi:uncharacterized delta-60 repeat protein